jgi:hypothetical protein
MTGVIGRIDGETFRQVGHNLLEKIKLRAQCGEARDSDQRPS